MFAGSRVNDLQASVPSLAKGVTTTLLVEEMKKPFVIIAILIALVALVGYERIGRGFRFLISDDRVARAPHVEQAASSQVNKSKESSGEGRKPSQVAPRSKNQGRADTIVIQPIGDRCGPVSVGVRITGEISPMHFIRAPIIVGSSEPSKEQIDRLHEAVHVVAGSLRPGAVIFEADGFSNSEMPILLFARDEFDLTAQVKSVYDTLRTDSDHMPKENPKAKPTSAPNRP
jgi:hypothetical protein